LKRAELWISLYRIGIPYAFLASLDVSWGAQYTRISPSLHAQRLACWDSPAYKLIKDIRWNKIDFLQGGEQIIELFESGRASPFDVIPDGKTWPEVLNSSSSGIP
jgi:hypothetical protein